MHKFVIKFSVMKKDQCISVTDLRKKTKECLQGLETSPKYVFVNNKPVAVLLGIAEYEQQFGSFADLEAGFKDMSQDTDREKLAEDWSEYFVKDADNETV